MGGVVGEDVLAVRARAQITRTSWPELFGVSPCLALSTTYDEFWLYDFGACLGLLLSIRAYTLGDVSHICRFKDLFRCAPTTLLHSISH